MQQNDDNLNFLLLTFLYVLESPIQYNRKNQLFLPDQPLLNFELLMQDSTPKITITLISY